MQDDPSHSTEKSLRSISESRPEFSMWFSTGNGIELTKTHFQSPLLNEDVIGIRGKTAGAVSTEATFQWTTAVQALCVLMMRAKATSLRCQRIRGPLLEGSQGTLASSLDAALYKQTAWLDMFGYGSRGDSLSKRVLPRTNPGRRHAGPVLITLNENVLPAASLKLYIDGQLIHNPEVLDFHAAHIERISFDIGIPIAQIASMAISNPLRI